MLPELEPPEATVRAIVLYQHQAHCITFTKPYLTCHYQLPNTQLWHAGRVRLPVQLSTAEIVSRF